MWKRQEEKKTNNPVGSAMPANPTGEETILPPPPPLTERLGEVGHETTSLAAAHIGKSLHIKGELRGSENMYIDGKVEGSIELRDHQLIVGPTGEVHANVNAKKVIIHGSVKGNIHAIDSVDVQKSGSLVGDIVVAGVVIAEGAYFKGSIDIQKAGEGKIKPGEPKGLAPPSRNVAPSRLDGVASGVKSSL
jgi:cytoskeletal protein CcmA (bactofilin family)